MKSVSGQIIQPTTIPLHKDSFKKKPIFFFQTPKKTNVYMDLSIRNNNITDFLFAHRWIMVDIGGLWWQDGRI